MSLTDKYGADLFKIEVGGDEVHIYMRDQWSTLRKGVYSKDQFLEIIHYVKEAEDKL